jgi:photosystem II stability/assembly factor-like uncharacterized protein
MKSIFPYFVLLILTISNSIYAQPGWQRINSNTTQNLYGMRFFGILPYAVYDEGFAVGDNGTILRTTDRGVSWQTMNSNNTDTIFKVWLPFADTVYAIGAANVFLKSTDQGFNWTPLPTPLSPQIRDLALAMGASSTVGYAIGDSGLVMRTITGGMTWQTPYNIGTSRNLRSISFLDFTHIYAVGDSGAIYKRLNVTVWAAQTVPPNYTGVNFQDVFFLPGLSNEESGWVVGTNGSILHTINSGSLWESQESNVTVTLRGVSFIDSQNGFVVGDSGTILRTSDGGAHWNLQSSGTSNSLYTVHVFSSDEAVAVGASGTILRTTSGGDPVSVNEGENGPVPRRFSLHQNYPNPFNPEARIEYTLPKSARVKLTVYNVLGEQVRTLVDQIQDTGVKSVEFDAKALPSGIYFYRLQAENFVEVKKMILIK